MKVIHSRQMNIALRSSAASFALGLALCSTQVMAQGVPPETAEAETDSVIIVTGSRIARPDLDGNSPISVVTSEEFQVQAGSANVENVLNDLPQITATTSSTSNNPGGGVATVNLRNLGSQRTLVLANGRRYMSFDVTQVVDINTIPASLIDRVDVVTGGQSAVYGSDAISGVVNFVLKQDFSGVQIDSSYSLTEEGDGQIWDIAGTIGSNFDDNRGNVTIYGQYTKRKPTFAGERDFSVNALSDNQDGSAPFAAGGSGSVPQGRIVLANQAQISGRTATETVGTSTIVNAGLNARLNNGCALPDQTTTFQVFTPAGTSTCFTPADGYNFNPVNYLQVPQERFLISAQGQYEISEAVTPYFEAQFANNRVLAQLAATPISNGTPFGAGTTGTLRINTNSPFLSPDIRAALQGFDANEVTCTPIDTFGNTACAPAATRGDGFVRTNFNSRTVQLGPRINNDERNAFRVVAGLKGDIGGGFSYDGYYMYARTKNSQRQTGNVAIDRFLAATTTVFQDPATGTTSVTPIAGLPGGGTLVCADATARAAGCVPANIFGLNNLSPEAVDYLGIGATNLETYTTEVASFSISNPDLYDIGAGGIGVAIGAEWRRESGQVEPDEFLSSGNVAGFNPGQPTGGSYTVREFFGELNVPIIRDGFINRFEINGAARFTKYSNSPGNVFTWAAGAQLSPIEDITFRGNYQRAIRGPSVNELFLGNTVSFAGNADFCGTAAAIPAGPLRDICTTQFNAAGAPTSLIGNPAIQSTDVNPLTFLGGNELLTEEKASTYTLGVVVKPSFLPRFSLTVDYYNIEIDNFIVSGIGTDTIGNLCFQQFNLAYCGPDRINRNSLGQIETFSDLYANTGKIKTDGIDVTAGYSLPLGAFLGSEEATVGFNLNGSYLLRSEIETVEGVSGVVECDGRFGVLACGVPTPKWRHTFRATLGLDGMSLSGQWRYIGKARDDDDDTDYGSENFKAKNYIDLTANLEVSDNFEFNIGVSNLFDVDPPLAASGQNGGNGEQSNTYPTLYEVLGRSYFVSGRVKF